MDALGQVLARQGRFTEAESLLRGAVSQRRELHGSRSQATAQSLDHLADLLRQRGDLFAAEPLTREADAIRSSVHTSRMLFEQAGQIWMMDSDGSNRVQLTRSGTNYSPTWAPGGNRVLFTAAAGATPGIYSIHPDGSSLTRLTTAASGRKRLHACLDRRASRIHQVLRGRHLEDFRRRRPTVPAFSRSHRDPMTAASASEPPPPPAGSRTSPRQRKAAGTSSSSIWAAAGSPN